MKKIALLLAVLLAFGMLAGCNAEKDEKAKEADFVVPGYSVNLYTGDGWTQNEETAYDLELSKDGVTMAVISFVSTDFVDMPTAQELFEDCNDDLLGDMTEVTQKEDQSTYKANGNSIISALYSANNGEQTLQYYCFLVDFADDADSMSWVMFSAAADEMKAQKEDLKAIVDSMTAAGEAKTQEELDAELEAAMGEDLEAVEGDDYIEEPVDEESPSPEEGVEPDPEVSETEEPTASTEPAETTASTEPAETTASTEPAETTASTEPAETTASTEATE